ncbi:TlpA disulfide reductase family protein [Flavobacterium sp.]|uniref:TlpA disulfide reductase family protein n=1 Tax=Flavobacterium sp. TaxID=239 RepID=UPI00120EE72D|nr:TlpA disulfide reductase family protein [Flavobacterium sp.]RZJ70823.1 MAG: AhpC/TSA family protein [Flavobacterium sp.]
MRSLVVACFLLIFGICRSQHDFEIKGSIDGEFSGKVYLSFDDKTDSCQVKNKQFQFKGKLSRSPVTTVLQLENSPMADDFFLDSGAILVEVKVGKAKDGNDNEVVTFRANSIKGGISQTRYENFLADYTSYQKGRLSKENLFAKGVDIVENFPENLSSVYVLEKLVLNFYESDKTILQGLFTRLKPDNSPEIVKSYAKMYDRLFPGNVVDVKRRMKHFSLPDQNDKLFNTETLSGKWILIDFWASWCAPCREEFAALREFYRKSNFEIVAVSIDSDKTAWLKLCDKLKTPWKNVRSDLESGSEVTSIYAITRGVSVTYLVNPDGIVVAKNPTKAELKAYLGL